MLNRTPIDLDAALLADGVLWTAANDACQAAYNAAGDDDSREEMMDAPRAVRSEIQSRILARSAHTSAGRAIKLAIFTSSAPACPAAEDAAYRRATLAELIESGPYEEAVAFSLALDLMADMAVTGTP